MLRHVWNLRGNEILARLQLNIEENNPSCEAPDEPDFYAKDPFFKRIFAGELNA